MGLITTTSPRFGLVKTSRIVAHSYAILERAQDLENQASLQNDPTISDTLDIERQCSASYGAQWLVADDWTVPRGCIKTMPHARSLRMV